MNQNTSIPRSHELLSRGNSRLLVIDVQTKLLPHIHDSSEVIERCRQLVLGAKTLGVPTGATEQYPKGLGPTVTELAPHLPSPIEKLTFSAMPVLDWNISNDADRYQVVICGVEAHVCVLQTAFDLIASGFRVYLPVDAVGSRHQRDRDTAVERLSAAGATICTTESVLFEWCETAAAVEFKAISQLVTGR
ncbi:MAG: hydrolase [Planctomycetota bacterium]|nr:hydrolase [Planctomycetota bacterium]MDA1211812.1 hydrolase [Planctomycetota bacterium]